MPTYYQTYRSNIVFLTDHSPISDGYDIPREEDLLKKALAQLNGVTYCLVSDDNQDTITIWRKKSEINTIKDR